MFSRRAWSETYKQLTVRFTLWRSPSWECRWLTTPISKTSRAKRQPASDGNFSSPRSSPGFPEGRPRRSTRSQHSSVLAAVAQSRREPTPELFVVSGSLFQFRISCEIVLNPQLRASFLQESLDRFACSGGLPPGEFRCRGVVVGGFLWVVVEVSGGKDMPRVSRLWGSDVMA